MSNEYTPNERDAKDDRANVKRVKLSKNARDTSKRLIVVIDNAHFVSHRIEKTEDKYELLTEEHIAPNDSSQRSKFKGKYDEYLPIKHKFRPDLVHQCLLMLFDSPLNHAELLQVYVRTHDGQLIQIHRETRMPRTYKRFSHLMANFLVAGTLPQVTTKDGPINLMRILEGSIDKQLHPDSVKFKIINYDEETPISDLGEIVKGDPKHKSSDNNDDSVLTNQDHSSVERHLPVVIFIDSSPVTLNINSIDSTKHNNAAPNKGTESKSDKDIKVCCISQYPLTPTHICVKVATAFEKYLNII